MYMCERKGENLKHFLKVNFPYLHNFFIAMIVN